MCIRDRDIITRKHYLLLDEEQKEQYKGIHNREIRTLFNIDPVSYTHLDVYKRQVHLPAQNTL